MDNNARFDCRVGPNAKRHLLVYSVENANHSRARQLLRTKNAIREVANSVGWSIAYSVSEKGGQFRQPSWQALTRWKFNTEFELRHFMGFQLGKNAEHVRTFGVWFRTLEFLIGLMLNSEFRETQGRICTIEQSVTAKHLHGWYEAENAGANWLLVVEDDARLHSKSNDLLRELVDFLEQEDPNTPIYLDVAGGFDFKSVVGGGVPNSFSGISEVSPARSNTACSYVLSRGAVQLFRQLLQKHTHLREIGIDFLMNGLFTKSTLSVQCYHMTPPALTHGSMTNEVQSWDPRQN